MRFPVKKLTILLAVTIACTALGWFILSPTAGAADSREVPQANPTRRALLIGISRYKYPIPSLPYPRNDVARMKELLESSPRYGFTVTTMTDEETDEKKLPTRENILDAIQKYLIDDAKPGDICLLYYSGHGSWVRNTESDEDDDRDETIVPMNAVRPVKPVKSFAELKDIRDKELVDLYNLALDKNVILTVILDSCHSGSAAKGENPGKDVPGIENFDLKLKPTAAQLRKPEERGALVMTAAEDYQIAKGGEIELNGQKAQYSYFTANLLKTLYRTPADIVSSHHLFSELQARMLTERTSQTPKIAGSELRMAQTIFGGATSETTGRARVVVEKKTGETRGYLLGGVVDGLEQGVELERIIPADPKVRIRVTSANISQSEYQIIGPSQTINVGDHFEQTKWVTKAEPDLTVWLSPSVTATLRKAITADLTRNKGQIVVTDVREKANYELTGRFDPASRKFEYSWQLHVAAANENKKAKAALKEPAVPLSLPPTTNWIADDGNGSAAGGLSLLALKLAKIRKLSKLSSPIPMGGSRFPYQLEVRNSKTKQRILAGKDLKSTEKFDYVLKLIRNSTDIAPKFFAYLISIDKNGVCQFKEVEIGSGSGKHSKFDPLAPPPEIVLIPDLPVDDKSLGTEILILIITDTALSNAASVLKSEGVKWSPESTPKGDEKIDDLTDLFKNHGLEITSKGDSLMPDTWAVQHLILRSVK